MDRGANAVQNPKSSPIYTRGTALAQLLRPIYIHHAISSHEATHWPIMVILASSTSLAERSMPSKYRLAWRKIDLVMPAANLTETSAPYLRKSNTLLARDVPSRKLAQTGQRFPLVFFCQQPLPHQLGSVNQQPALFTDRRTVCQQSKRGTIKQIKKQDDRSLQALVIKY